MASLSTIGKRFRRIAASLDAPTEYAEFRMTPRHDGSRHCELVDNKYTYITSERGEFFDGRSTTDPDELMFWLVSDMTWLMASDYELANRDPHNDVDTRIVHFDRHVELLATINENWAELVRVKYEKLLTYDDHNAG